MTCPQWEAPIGQLENSKYSEGGREEIGRGSKGGERPSKTTSSIRRFCLGPGGDGGEGEGAICTKHIFLLIKVTSFY